LEDIKPKSVNFCKQIFFDCFSEKRRKCFTPKRTGGKESTSILICCKRTKHYEFFDHSYSNYLEEVNIVKVIE